MSDSEGARSTPTEIAVAVVRHGGNVLIGRRPQGAALAGLWEFPGGKVEPGETPAAAAVRECREETGLAIEVVAAFPSCDHHYRHGRVRLNFLDCRVQGLAAEPHSPFLWVAVDRLAQYEFPAANAQVLAILADQHAAGRRADSDKPV